MNKKYGVATNPFVAIEPIDSKKCELGQINDLILGSIGYDKNGYKLITDSSKAKIELCNHIATSAGLEDLSKSTPRKNHRFGIWNFKLN